MAKECASAKVGMCSGKACRKRSEHAQLHDRLSAEADVVRFGCVGVCEGPVVVVAPPAGQPVVVARVRSPKAQRDLVRVVRGSELSHRLARRVVDGSKSSKAVRRARRAA